MNDGGATAYKVQTYQELYTREEHPFISLPPTVAPEITKPSFDFDSDSPLSPLSFSFSSSVVVHERYQLQVQEKAASLS